MPTLRRSTALAAGAALALTVTLGACSSSDDATDRDEGSTTTSSAEPSTTRADAAGTDGDGPVGGPTAPTGSGEDEAAGSDQVAAAGRSLSDQSSAFGDGLSEQVSDVRSQAEQVATEVAGADGSPTYAMEGSYADLKLQVAEVDREVESAGGSVPSAAKASWDAFVRSVDELGGTVRISG